MATASDIVALALRELAVLSATEAPQADHTTYCEDVLSAAFDEVVAVQGFSFGWSPADDDVPDEYKRPLSLLLAAEVAPHFQIPGPPRSMAIARMRALAFADNRVL